MAKKLKNGNGNGDGGEGSIENAKSIIKTDLDYANKNISPFAKYKLNKASTNIENTYNKASDYVGEASDYISNSASSVATAIGNLFSGGSNSSEKQTSGGTPKVYDPPGSDGKIRKTPSNERMEESVNKANNEYNVLENYNSDVNTENSNGGTNSGISEDVYKDFGGG